MPWWLPIEIAALLGKPKTHTDQQRRDVARNAISNVTKISERIARAI